MARRSRPLRFVVSGGLAAAIQLTILAVLLGRSMNPFVANGFAFMVGAQCSFLLNGAFTWRDRTSDDVTLHRLGARWLMFHAAITGTTVLNLAIFAAAQIFVPHLIAAALGTGGSATLNFIAHDSFTFRATRPMGDAP